MSKKVDKRKQYFFICDTETTCKDTIADFAGIIVDKKGKIYQQIAVLVDGHYGKFKLFHDARNAEEIWTLTGLRKRNEVYKNMLNSGDRMMASPQAINKWLKLAIGTYPNLVFTAYNSKFDLGKMKKTGIHFADPNLSYEQLVHLEKMGENVHGFHDYFCLMYAAQNEVKGKKDYVQHCLDRKWVTPKLNLRTNAECMAEYVQDRKLPSEPHTALEDVLYYELSIFEWLINKKPYQKFNQQAYNWRDWQLNKLVIPK